MNYCQHFSALTIIKKQYWKIHRSFGLTKDIWLCLNKKCIQKKQYMQERISLQNHCMIMKKDHQIFLNIYTKQIKCINCDIQILDFDQLSRQQFQEHQQDNNPLYIRQMFQQKLKQQENLLYGQLQIPESHQKGQRGLTGLKKKISNSYINSTIHFFSSLKIIKSLCKYIDISAIRKSNKILFHLINIINTIWSGRLRISSSQQFQKYLIKQNVQFKGYRRKYIFDLVKIILTTTHQQLLFYQQIYKGKIFQQQIDQWKIQQSLNHKQYSPITISFLGKMQYNFFCKVCNTDINSNQNYIALKIPKLSNQKSQLKPKKSRINTQPSKSISLLTLLDDLMKCKFPVHRKCQKCNTDCISKSCKIKQLPNMLLIYFDQQFIINGQIIDYPLQNLNLQKFTDQIKKGTNYIFVSCIGLNERGRYFTYSKHYKNNNFYKYEDEIVKLWNRKPEKVSLLLYERIQQNSNISLFHNINSNIKLQIKPEIPLPQLWFYYLKCLHSPHPLFNPLVCQHNKLKPLVNSKFKSTKKVPKQIFEVLLDKFGGRRFEGQICNVCMKFNQILNNKKILQKQLAKNCDNYPLYTQYLINKTWIQKWKKYLYMNTEVNYFIKGNPHPNSITNNDLILGGKVNPAKKLDIDYKIISGFVWLFLFQIYGGGPQILIKSKKKIKQNVQEKQEVFRRQIINKIEQINSIN